MLHRVAGSTISYGLSLRLTEEHLHDNSSPCWHVFRALVTGVLTTSQQGAPSPAASIMLLLTAGQVEWSSTRCSSAVCMGENID